MTSNLPPGVTDSMLPGNSPEDLEWEKFHDFILVETIDNNLTPEQSRLIWRVGLLAYNLLTEGKNN